MKDDKKSKKEKAIENFKKASIDYIDEYLEDINWEWGEGRELNEIVKQIVDADFDVATVIEITRLTEHIGNRLIDMYSKKFPKKCNNCGRIYQTRNDYLKATFPLRGKGTIYEALGVQEYRNCVCGSTLLIITDDRRDNTKFGQARRDLFDQCVKKLTEISSRDEKDIRDAVRKVFRLIINKSQVVESLENVKVEDIG